MVNMTMAIPEQLHKIIKKHPEIGFSILQPIEFLNKFISMVLYHHERFDGKGYPEGKKYEETSLWTRILTVADAYHAMRSDRSYRKALSKEAAFKELVAGSGSQFDSEIVNAALKVLESVIANDNWEMKTFEKTPQILLNVPVSIKKDLSLKPYSKIIEEHKKLLINGRFVIRYSGTENLLRVMVEDECLDNTTKLAHALAEKLQDALQKSI